MSLYKSLRLKAQNFVFYVCFSMKIIWPLKLYVAILNVLNLDKVQNILNPFLSNRTVSTQIKNKKLMLKIS